MRKKVALAIISVISLGTLASFLHVPMAWRSKELQTMERADVVMLLGAPDSVDTIKNYDVWSSSISVGKLQIFPVYLIIHYGVRPNRSIWERRRVKRIALPISIHPWETW